MQQDNFKYKAHLFICRGKSCAEHWDAEDVKASFKEKIKQNGLETQARACVSSCLNLCDDAPNILVYPQGKWFSHIEEADWPEIFKYIQEQCQKK